jgi:dGTPase
LDLEMRLAHMLPPVAIRAYRQKIDEDDSPLSEWHHRAHLILDYICGMTDHFALKTFQLLSGIRVNGD